MQWGELIWLLCKQYHVCFIVTTQWKYIYVWDTCRVCVLKFIFVATIIPFATNRNISSNNYHTLVCKSWWKAIKLSKLFITHEKIDIITIRWMFFLIQTPTPEIYFHVAKTLFLSKTHKDSKLLFAYIMAVVRIIFIN